MEQIEYTRTVVPSSMRSPYWKYFGFPSDNSNNILTRQKIVCTICNTTIAYNKNTSNLRTHLMAKHVEIFKKIVPIPSASVVQKHNEDKVNVAESDFDKTLNNKRHCLEILDGDYGINSSLQNQDNLVGNCTVLPEYHNMDAESNTNREFGMHSFPTHKIDFETQNTDFITFLPTNDSEITEDTADNNGDTLKSGDVVYAINDVDLYEENEQQLHSMDIMLADLIQTDLLPLDTLEEHGFCKYNQQLTGLKIDADTIKRIKKVIETRFANVNQIVTSHACRLSQSKPYSLSFEIYKNIEGLEVVNIYFNYLNEKQLDLLSTLYTSIPVCNTDVNISEILVDIDIKNCSGIVIPCLNNEFQFVLDFARLYDLPIIECLESTLSRCLKKIFEQTEFYLDYKHFLKTIYENKNEMRLLKSNCRTQCKWSILNFLDNIFNNVEETQIEKWNEFRASFEYLKPLKMTLDVIMDEPLPLCSLTRPLIKKLFEEHFNSMNREEPGISEIQKILEKELYERIMSQRFLNEATFFDKRFHHSFALQEPFSDITSFKSQVVKRFRHGIQLSYITKTNDVKLEQSLKDSFGHHQKCSSLKSFFKRDVSSSNTDVTANLKTNIDLEFELYYTEDCLDLDQSPLLWWSKNSDKYKQLSKIAANYLTIPCCCLPRLRRIDLEQRYRKLERRRNLSQFCNIESKLWFLHYNEDVAELT